MKQWYETLFENYGQKYDSEIFTQGTIGECDYIEQEINFNRSIRILDIGCGTGRHSIELSKRGYDITGIDLSDSQLARAREKAGSQGLRIEFLKHDARNLPFTNEYDLVIMLCEGAFPLMETDEMNYQILENATKSLKDDGKFIFTTLNALFPLCQADKQMQAENTNETLFNDNRFDLMTFRKTSVLKVVDDSGKEKELICNERYYCPSEIIWYLKSLNFRDIGIYGCKLGAFSRNDKLSKNDFEMLVVAKKS